MALVGILMIGWGALMACVPYVGWYAEIGWKLKDAEPSSAALVMNRIGGVILVIIGLVLVSR